jgi:hypothetical protein
LVEEKKGMGEGRQEENKSQKRYFLVRKGIT